MKKPLATKVGDQYPLAEMDAGAFAKSPCTRGFFLDAHYQDDGSDRQQGYLMLRPEPTRWTASLKEPTTCQTIFLAAPTLADLWKLIEAVLGDDKSPWQDDEFARERKAKTRGKRS